MWIATFKIVYYLKQLGHFASLHHNIDIVVDPFPWTLPMMRMRVGLQCLPNQIMTTYYIGLNITIYYLDIFVDVILEAFKVCISA